MKMGKFSFLHQETDMNDLSLKLGAILTDFCCLIELRKNYPSCALLCVESRCNVLLYCSTDICGKLREMRESCIRRWRQLFRRLVVVLTCSPVIDRGSLPSSSIVSIYGGGGGADRGG